MSASKEQMAEVIRKQPDDASYEEIMRELAFEQTITRGLDDSRQGRVISNEELKHVPRALRLDDDLLLEFCEANRDLRIERNAHGDLEIMPPTGAETGTRNADLTIDFGTWARVDGRGRVFDSSTGFLLPSGAMRAPDLAWVRRERLAALSRGQKRKFLPLVPDCVIELASPQDTSDALHAKMREWRAAGVRLGWLILPDRRQVWRYTPDAEPVRLDHPETLGDADLLPGLALPLARIWEPDL